MKKIFCPLVAGLALMALTGCGLKGPLYFPPANKNAQPTTQQAQDSTIQSTVPDRNDRAQGDGPTQVNY
ncbi:MULTISPECIES: LPS translocon maturation chaperone LptM [Tenebrionibacter/Tenebrionicola group]|jgi:predicted small lipoprotein YifL|uniref:LPS-assembly lipoprotein LptM n=2 Tax=Tenebrionibacter/Tenebrionicola group TaxID=2969848 RepID=A0A8K0XX46_9ENTR|nr:MULTISPECIES: lipoprotein [Tenebrionibacter/Tenebrionicola group]MBK4714992.1 lipoprotein [Tenebrionibacter intestinalis]MBV4414162.1 lipoprotein [Tenebrionicola larvae]MBV5095667.1 lipoprotein [Tenebrionicola larvae]